MKRTVLCIDDSSTALILLEYALNEAGFQAVLALSVKEAIQIINKQIPDLILLDLSMPAISGYEFLEMRAKLNLQKVPIIVVSAYDSKESVSKIQDLGAIDFISKPIRIETLMEKIRTHLKH
jgi:DNA-binding response OmpR family regulator